MPSNYSANPAVVPKWDTSDGYSPVVHFLEHYHPLSNELKNYISAHTFRKTIQKTKHLIKIGDSCDHLYLVQKGILRGYVRDEGKEITNWIAFEGCLVASARGFFLRSTSVKNIQVIEDAELIGIHYDDLEYCFEHFIEMNIIGRRILEEYYRASEERALISRLPSATLKYKKFLIMYSNVAERVQLKYIASFLGMTMETLSRVKNNSGQYKILL